MPLKGAKKRSCNKKYYTDSISEKKRRPIKKAWRKVTLIVLHALQPFMIKIPTVVQSLLPHQRIKPKSS